MVSYGSAEVHIGFTQTLVVIALLIRYPWAHTCRRRRRRSAAPVASSVTMTVRRITNS